MKFNVSLFSLSMIAACVFSLATSCSDDPTPGNEEELITFVKLKFTKAGSEPLEFTWSDPDGEIGSGEPVVEDVSLLADTEYDLSVSIGDESSGTLVDITADISEEATDHQFFFQPDSDLEDVIDFSYGDEDDNGYPVGLGNNANTSDAGSGKLKVILRHKPKKNAAGVADGDITHAGGDTDIEIEFNVAIEK